ncbi:antitoxin Xre/MbcA/ParS toxin-binding domain-containing protein [Sphingopyxis sp.]|uniref:antitoxin Xre/MbcA/ParS toxin-binding domain-containing protein n=1 Tax=Sphingopyxis sp. TaxID=1908224 RepID=UPI002B46D8C0|nr:antitoxin Xre/MbcA/ParS toxin-binding domain-containing protein [Sphingopyxis sp.]HJS12190.1 antitoxin Xre/MbcA/ParS toxin-binding domain-containing protein [Sphingopyxis sp.]
MSIDEPNDPRLAAKAYFMKRGVDPIQHGGAGMRTFLNIAELWSLSDEEQLDLLGVHDLPTFEDWKIRVRAHEAVAIPIDMIVRIGCVLSIYGSLVTLFPEERAADWLREPNAHRIFAGKSALAVMTTGELGDLDKVVGYLLSKIYG